MQTTSKVVLRPLFFELAVVFAAGFIIGHYTNTKTPTTAELEELLRDVPEEKRIETIEEAKKPMVQYNNGVLSLNLTKGRRIFR